jgi:hypothetical protein
VFQVSFDRLAVGEGETNVIRVDARDDRSGVASMHGAVRSPSGSALIWFTGVTNAGSGMCEGNIAIPKDVDCGEWSMYQLAVKDNAGNTTLLVAKSPILARASFHVSSAAGCDFTAPTLDAFDLSPTLVSSETATEILLTAKVYEAESGMASITGWFEGPVSVGGQVPKNAFRFSPDPQNPDAPWTAKLQVPQLTAKGTWKVGIIRLEDKAHNIRVYTSADPVISGHVFQVQ